MEVFLEAFALVATGYALGIWHARLKIDREVRAGRMFWLAADQHDSREDG